MARIPRVLITGEPTAYHLISRTALDGYPIEDAEKDFFVDGLRRFSRIYFVGFLGLAAWANTFTCW